ncbi:MAG: hypothetical protein K6E78_02485 [Treponema sp.]|nr:hypothetical protein [Treponema sp.]
MKKIVIFITLILLIFTSCTSSLSSSDSLDNILFSVDKNCVDLSNDDCFTFSFSGFLSTDYDCLSIYIDFEKQINDTYFSCPFEYLEDTESERYYSFLKQFDYDERKFYYYKTYISQEKLNEIKKIVCIFPKEKGTYNAKIELAAYKRPKNYSSSSYISSIKNLTLTVK